MESLQMQAVQINRYGPPEVAMVTTTSIRPPRGGEILVRVFGSSVNRVDLLVRAGKLRIVLGHRFPRGLGLDFAGEIAQLGKGVTDLDIGTGVWGFTGKLPGTTGTAAEYVLVRRDRLARAPVTRCLVEASALPVVALTALQALRDALAIQRGQKLLVVGASGGVGSAASQIGRSMGASVSAVCSASAGDLWS